MSEPNIYYKKKGLFIEPIYDDVNKAFFWKINQREVSIDNILKLRKLLVIFLKHFKFSCEIAGENFIEQLKNISKDINETYAKWRSHIGIIMSRKRQDLFTQFLNF